MAVARHSKVFVAVRGDPEVKREDEKKKEEETKKKEDPEEKKEQKDEKGKDDKPKPGRSYEGCMFRCGFKADRDVGIVGLDFYGPAKQAIAAYKGRVEFVKAVKIYNGVRRFFKFLGPMFEEQRISPKYEVDIRGIKGKPFTVWLPEPVNIPAEEWVTIKFELQGPDTEYMDDAVRKHEHEMVLDDCSRITFKFLRSTSQLPRLRFVVPGLLENGGYCENSCKCPCRHLH